MPSRGTRKEACGENGLHGLSVCAKGKLCCRKHKPNQCGATGSSLCKFTNCMVLTSARGALCTFQTQLQHIGAALAEWTLQRQNNPILTSVCLPGDAGRPCEYELLLSCSGAGVFGREGALPKTPDNTKSSQPLEKRHTGPLHDKLSGKIPKPSIMYPGTTTTLGCRAIAEIYVLPGDAGRPCE